MKTNNKLFFTLMIGVYMAITTLIFFGVGLLTAPQGKNEAIGAVTEKN